VADDNQDAGVPEIYSTSQSVTPFQDLNAPEPAEAEPPLIAKLIAFSSVLLAGLFGGMIGYGSGDLMFGAQIWSFVGLVIGAVGCAVGVGIVAALALQAMSEWHTASHPEATPPDSQPSTSE